MKPWIGVAMFNDRVKLTIARLAIKAVQDELDPIAKILTAK